MVSYKYLYLLLIVPVIMSCGGGDIGSSGSENTSGNTGIPPADLPLVNVIASPSSVSRGEFVLIEWSTKNASDCVASGAWFGDKEISGKEVVGPVNQTDEFILSCTGPGGATAESVIIHVGVSSSVAGSVDSSFINRKGSNRIYIYQGSVEADDLDGDAGDPVLVIPVYQVSNTCSWEYVIPDLPDGNYTIAFTNEAELDTPKVDDPIQFMDPKYILVDSSTTTIHNFLPKNIIRVGKNREYKTPSAAILNAGDGDIIEIDADTYQNDNIIIRQNNIVLRGVGGRVHLQATRLIQYTPGNDQENGMGIWVTRGSNITIENIEFSGAKVPDLNGAGIRNQGRNLTICNCYFHDNENGFLGGAYGTLRIEYSEFNNNGLGEVGRTHNIYVDEGEEFIIKHSYSHHTHIGHNIKTRSRINYVLYNKIMDEQDGDSSYAIDVPNGGLTYIIGNLVQQGIYTDNSIIFPYGAEGLSSDGRKHELYVVNNTFVNDRMSGMFIDINAGATLVKIANNIFAGGGTVINGQAELLNNLVSQTPGFVDKKNYNYRLTMNSPAIDTGMKPGNVNGYELTLEYQYLEKSRREPRPADGAIDIGAYEYFP